jgi:chromosome segregation protein
MRLIKLKMSGFKSFVDPTTIYFRTNLSGIVGPNGCGKSNIIDAVRWVLGESSAKQLRGESMSDVIFNGSSNRKQVGQASVELFFDNSEASFGGEFAKYSEISLRREVGRDGISNYYLNNIDCRRKDIVDIFLGTGVGTNSYAIISQGTISQFIEAKPDDLKVYLDEAAGVSKYKERRRETENRIKHTRENLIRLNDIREELEKQITHLKNQANKAELYKKHKQTERNLHAELNALYWQNIDKNLHEYTAQIKANEIGLETKITELHFADAKIAEAREQQIISNDAFNEIQTKYYKIGNNITRLEQQIQHDNERKEQLQQELAKNDQSINETLQHENDDLKQIKLLSEESTTLRTDLDNLLNKFESSKQELNFALSQMDKWQSEWDKFNLESADVNQSFEVLQMSITHLDHLVTVETQHITKIHEELLSFDFANLSDTILTLDNKQSEIKDQSNSLTQISLQKQQQIAEKRELTDKLSSELDAVRGKLQSLLGRYSSLEALQQAALGKNDSGLVNWLTEHNFDDKPRLVQGIEVESGFETAVETVLGQYLEGVCIEGLDVLASVIDKVPEGHLVFFDINNNSALLESSFNKAELLNSKVKAKWRVDNLLSGVYVVDSLSEAINLRKALAANESVVTKDGIWLGTSWLRVNSNITTNKSGILQRAHELRQLESIISEEQKNISLKEQEMQNSQTELVSLEQEYHDLQHQLRSVTVQLGELQGEVSAKRKHFDYLRDREQILQQEIKSHEDALLDAKTRLNSEKLKLDEYVIKKETINNERKILSEKRDEYQQIVDKAREGVENDRQLKDSIAMRLELLQSQVGYLQQNTERAKTRLVALRENHNVLLQTLADLNSPAAAMSLELQAALQEHLAIEAEMVLAKQKVGEWDNSLKELDHKRAYLQDEVQALNSCLEKLRVDSKELQVKSDNYKEQTSELGFDLSQVISQLGADANIPEWEEKLVGVVKKIDNLGAINLAAIEEYEENKKRKEYLDAQNQDLVQALETLENAILKIDNDTKIKFQETFNQVNKLFQENFPKIFKGGNAYIELTDNNILDSGVVIFAQPPGKRNSTIHLLSGGEKALTAIALIFAIFQLNPAPFCLLDEVDAPLDDVNIVRFCNLVKEMSESIQLVFISHNKLALEMAEQLNGVTMQEPGVSRVVSVDIQQAMAMQEKTRKEKE